MQNPKNQLLILLIQFLSIVIFNQNIKPIRCKDESSGVKVDVGIILDFERVEAKVMHTCILLALEDYHSDSRSAIRIVPHFMDSKEDDVEAASAAIHLLKEVQVEAIFGPQMSTQADFVIDIGNRVKVPIISSATSPSISVKENPSFIRAALPSSSQTKSIAAIVENFDWREVVIIYEDSYFGTGILPVLTDALLEISTSVSYRSVISPSANDDQILKELYKLKTMQTRVFIVHLQPLLASRLFQKAKEAGMMSSGYVWIITDVLTGLLDLVDPSVIESSMQGVLGVKPYVPRSIELSNFTRRWRRRFRHEYPDMDAVKLNVFGLWAYDGITALAEAVKKVGAGTAIQKFKKADTRENLTDLDALGTSRLGPLLIDFMQNITLKTGLSGDFRIFEGELQPSPYQIVNIIGKGERGIGFWTEKDGISRHLKMNGKATHNKQLGPIIWPGESIIVPKGWEMPTSGKKLRVGVPAKRGLAQFIKVEIDPKTQEVTATGFCADVFKEVIQSVPYAVPYEFFPFPKPDPQNTQKFPGYDDLVLSIVSKTFDAVVGDVTILANRSNYVDFTLPFTASDISVVVPVRNDERKNAWIFLKPLKSDLWITTGAFFVFIGFVIWVLEHRENKYFRGPKRKQVGMIFFYSFSTLVFAHSGERMMSNLSRFVVIVWVFVVLVLTSSYTASLTSMLTVQQLQPTITDLNDLIKNGEYIGYQEGSFVKDVLKRMKFDSTKFIGYSSLEQYDDALSRGSKNGGVGAIVDELPYLRLFLNKYCRKYTMVGPTYKTAGFGFAFPKGSPLVPDFSRAILKVMEDDIMINIIQKWFGNETDCPEQDGIDITSDRLTLDSFRGLFLIAGVSAGSALIIFILRFLYQNREILASDDSIWEKLSAIAKAFDEAKQNTNSKSKQLFKGNEIQMATPLDASADHPDILPDLHSQSAEIRISDGQGVSPPNEGFSTTEPGTPVHETITER